MNRLILTLFVAGHLWAGDAATFLSVGCSEDFRYYAFAQYGVQDGSGFPYAELYIVDVPENNFVPSGVVKHLWKEEALAQGIHVLLNTRAATDSILSAYHISELFQMRHVVPPADSERTAVKWQNKDGETIYVSMQQESRGDPAQYSSEAAFSLHMTAPQDTLAIGKINRFRDYIVRYDIDRVLANEKQTAFVFVLRMTQIGFEGPSIRYMVETVMLD